MGEESGETALDTQSAIHNSLFSIKISLHPLFTSLSPPKSLRISIECVVFPASERVKAPHEGSVELNFPSFFTTSPSPTRSMLPKPLFPNRNYANPSEQSLRRPSYTAKSLNWRREAVLGALWVYKDPNPPPNIFFSFHLQSLFVALGLGLVTPMGILVLLFVFA